MYEDKHKYHIYGLADALGTDLYVEKGKLTGPPVKVAINVPGVNASLQFKVSDGYFFPDGAALALAGQGDLRLLVGHKRGRGQYASLVMAIIDRSALKIELTSLIDSAKPRNFAELFFLVKSKATKVVVSHDDLKTWGPFDATTAVRNQR